MLWRAVPLSDCAHADVTGMDAATVTATTGPCPTVAVAAVRAVLSDDLLKAKYRSKPRRTVSAGHCYSASEALYHLLGGKAAGLTPMQIRHEGDSHWFLRTPDGPLDATADQFATPVPYEQATGRGFLTREPSSPAAEILRRINAM